MSLGKIFPDKNQEWGNEALLQTFHHFMHFEGQALRGRRQRAVQVMAGTPVDDEAT